MVLTESYFRKNLKRPKG